MQALMIPIDELDDMKLRTEEQNWLTGEISRIVKKSVDDAVDQFRPHGGRRVTNFIREWGLAGTLITVIVALLALAATAFYEASNRIGKEATFETKTSDTLDSINKRLDKIDTALSLAQLEKITANPIDKNSALAAKKLITDAQAQSIKLPADAVEQAGQKLVAASTNEPTVWDVSLDFMDYKSFNNTIPASITFMQVNANVMTRYTNFDVPPGMQQSRIAFAGFVPKESAAQMMKIGNDLNAGMSVGNAYLYSIGGAAILDGMQLRNVIFQNVHVVYNGGPLIMTNVYFINCTFDMKSSKNTQKLALATLEPSPATTFSAS
jgi:hypothetical protein